MYKDNYWMTFDINGIKTKLYFEVEEDQIDDCEKKYEYWMNRANATFCTTYRVKVYYDASQFPAPFDPDRILVHGDVWPKDESGKIVDEIVECIRSLAHSWNFDFFGRKEWREAGEDLIDPKYGDESPDCFYKPEFYTKNDWPFLEGDEYIEGGTTQLMGKKYHYVVFMVPIIVSYEECDPRDYFG